MRNKDFWIPTKYIYKDRRLVASRDPNEVAVGSRLITDLIAEYYDLYIKQYVKGKLADLGCGKVPLYAAYKDYVSENMCVDWQNPRSEFSDFICDLTKALPFENGEFNTIILSDVLEHIPNPEHLWKEMHRILSVRGHILMNTPFYYPLHAKPHDFYRYTEYGLRRLAERSGFKVLLLKALGGTPEILSDVAGKHLQYMPIIGKAVSTGIQKAIYFLVKTSLGKKYSEKTSKTFPYAYFMVAERR